MRQMAYARRLLGANGKTKREIALDVGYSPHVARSVTSHIEASPGFNNAMVALAIDSNNLALAAMHEFKVRGFEDFTNKELVGALNAVGSAWSRFNAIAKEKPASEISNKLRTVILQRIENQTNVRSASVAASSNVPQRHVSETIDDAVIEVEPDGKDDFGDF